MYIAVVPKGYKTNYAWSPDDGCSFGNCGNGSEDEFISWVNGGFKKQPAWGFTDCKGADKNELKIAIKKAQDAGYIVSFNCGCGDGWQEPRCGDGSVCIVNGMNKDMDCGNV